MRFTIRAFMIGLGLAALSGAAVLALHDSTAEPTTLAPVLAASSPSFLSTSASIRVPTATAAPAGSMPMMGAPRSLSLPTANPSEQAAASHTRLYLTAFQNENVSVIDPLSGHAVHEIAVEGDQAGMTVSPDGTRLYVVDGQGDNGQMRVFDTQNWKVIHQEPVQDRLMLLGGGNPISLSGDGRWLVVPRYSYPLSRFPGPPLEGGGDARAGWNTVFDTRQMHFLPDDPLQPVGCSQPYAPPTLVGQAGHPRLYAVCDGNVMALDAGTFAKLWQVPVPSTHPSDVLLSPDGLDLYAVFPLGSTGCFSSLANDLGLYEWETRTGQLVKQVHLSDQVPVPTGTCGLGGRVYLTFSPEGTDIFLAWEDRLWEISSGSMRVMRELKLPSAVDGMALSLDRGESYLLPSTMGDLAVQERGMWAVDVKTLSIVRLASDWPQLLEPFMLAAPAPSQ